MRKPSPTQGEAVQQSDRQLPSIGVTMLANDGSWLPSPTGREELLSWLLDVMRPMNRTRVKKLLRQGRVSINGEVTTRHDHPVQPGDRIAIAREHPTPAKTTLADAGLSIVFEDDAMIVIDKPSGLLTVATHAERIDTAFARLKAHLEAPGKGRPFVVHRLDRETSGLLMFARTAAVRDSLQANWTGVTKTYLGVVEGKPMHPEGVVTNYLREGHDLRVRQTRNGSGAQKAVTRYRVVAACRRYTLLEVILETGRKHQIRVHLAGLGCPVIGDATYGASRDPVGRLGLHAWRLALDHPVTGKHLELESPFPRELARLMD